MGQEPLTGHGLPLITRGTQGRLDDEFFCTAAGDQFSADIRRGRAGTDGGGRDGLGRVGHGIGLGRSLFRLSDIRTRGRGVAGRVVVGDGGSGSPYAAWLAAAAVQAEQTAAQAAAMIAEFEAVKTAVVQPMLVAANRADLVSLVMSNLFGQNAPAIAAIEATYEQMWAADVSAMSAYHAGASAIASALSPFSKPLQNLAGLPAWLASGAPAAAMTAAAGIPALAGGPTAINLGIANVGGGNVGNANNGLANIGNANLGNYNFGSGNFGNSNIGSASLGNNNIGFGNLGSNNVGVGNLGNLNTGFANTGLGNFGFGNTGNNNIGIGLTGNNQIGIGGLNSGTGNFGLFNSGSGNVGFFNSGNGNFGIGNSGNFNTGGWNSGHGNTGFFNAGSFNTGCWTSATRTQAA